MLASVYTSDLVITASNVSMYTEKLRLTGRRVENI